MFKKLKDKLAEEVKSSPQRIQQFAQAAQAAVTSASSSISDITNTDLFSIGDNDNRTVKADMSPVHQKNTFQDVGLVQAASSQASTELVDYASGHDLAENQRQRRLSNSSFASDVSFRLPSYESPSMYHLQSDMDVSASEAEDRGISGNAVSLDRVTKEQLYAAYRRTQERYTKYRTQYADLARHYKLLERENAKARSVLVETQDKALRRISELREQCTLEQSAKAHLEKALRVELEERNMKIETLNTKILFLQNDDNSNNVDKKVESEPQLINLSMDNDNENNQTNEESSSEHALLNNKIEKLEHLVKKYKESLKINKEKNAQLSSELQILSSELENKSKEYEQQKDTIVQLTKAREQIQELNDFNEELQNKINSYDFSKTKETSTLEIDLQKSQEEIGQLQSKIQVFTKREEEYAISLAENKLSIHKELESKENEIKSLKDTLSASVKEIQSLNIVISDYKNSISKLEEERVKLNNDINELNLTKRKITELESQLQELKQKCQSLENLRIKADEEFKCLQLQLKQETAEKLAMVDRNAYLEDKNTQISEENAKKSLQLSNLDNELKIIKRDRQSSGAIEEAEKIKMLQEIDIWKSKYTSLESEIQEERVELVKLQTEIEKLLANHELIQMKNAELNDIITDLQSEKAILQENHLKSNKIKIDCDNLLFKVRDLKQIVHLTSKETESLKQMNNDVMPAIKENVNMLINNVLKINDNENDKTAWAELQKNYFDSQIQMKKASEKLETASNELNLLHKENEELKTEVQMKVSEINQTKEQLVNISRELSLLHEENRESKTEIQNKDSEIVQLREQFAKTSSELNSLYDKNKESKAENQSIESDMIRIKEQLTKTSKELDLLHKENGELKTTNQVKESEVIQMSENSAEVSNKLKLLDKENKELKAEIEAKVLEVQHLSREYDISLNELQSIKEKQQELMDSILKSENRSQHLQNTLENDKEQMSVIVRNAEAVEQKNQNLTQRNKEIEGKNELLSAEMDALRTDHEENISNFDAIKKEYDALVNKTKMIENDKNIHIEKLEEKIQKITQENITLESQSTKIASNVRDLESELAEVKKLHVEMEIEKDRLNSILEKIEINEKQNSPDFTKNKDTQTDRCTVLTEGKNETCERDRNQTEYLQEIKVFKEVASHISEPSLKQNVIQDLTNDNELSEKYDTLKDEYNSQKEENRRLQSDISGLQTHLAKISKENSVLNDKLRELIASSENSPHRNETLSFDLTDLKAEIQLGKEKIEDLSRENTLLIDENLELKDQLSSQNYMPSTLKPPRDNEKEQNKQLLEKYNNLNDTKNKLEKRLIDLEYMNNSVTESMVLMQENNEKLRLTNDKLERRLDEALVSLRHLHSLQENTELEYLRNILYEYLTGTGTHSITLAKVLAAVVKFNDSQTEQVLQKEKERQGILRQLGLL